MSNFEYIPEQNAEMDIQDVLAKISYNAYVIAGMIRGNSAYRKVAREIAYAMHSLENHSVLYGDYTFQNCRYEMESAIANMCDENYYENADTDNNVLYHISIIVSCVDKIFDSATYAKALSHFDKAAMILTSRNFVF
jgi:hypothetical protein